MARLAIAPLVLEARGLDVTPTMIDRLKLVGDEEAANALCIIMSNEITHVSVVKRWFECMCGIDRLNPSAHGTALLNVIFTAI